MRITKFILELLFWMLAAGALLFAAGVAMGVAFWPVVGYFAAVAVLGAIPLALRTIKMIRRRRAATVMTYLEQSVRLNLPLPPMLWAAQRSEPGKLGMRLGQLRQRLEDGLPVGAAVQASLPELGDRASSLIEVGERIGRLPHAMARVVQEQAFEARIEGANDSFYRAYPVVMSLVLSTVLAILLIFVIPKYEAIFHDFGIKFPYITQVTLDISRELGPLLLVVTVIAIFWMAGSSLWEMVNPRRSSGSTPLTSMRDRALWVIPVAHSIARDRGLADVCDMVAEALRAGTPADRALAEAAQIQSNAVLRERIDGWATGVANGLSLGNAARAARLPELISGMLASARGSDDAAEVFGFLGRYYGSRYSATAALLRAAMVPLTVFFFAFLVTCVALAMFVPIIRMIDSIMPRMSFL